jgi:Fic family protein
MSKSEVLADAKKVLADLVFNMAAHEGNPMTQPDVQTLIIDGITVGGYKIGDSEQVSNIALGWRELIRLVESNQFTVDKATITHLHGIYAKNEALTWGEFRERQVTIAGTEYMPPHHSELDELFKQMVADYEQAANKDDGSYDLFLTCARNQYFNDGNKRAGQYLMNGSRLMLGLPVITIAARKSSDYNAKMIRFYNTNQRDEIKQFLKECRVNVQLPRVVSKPSDRRC